MCYLCDGLKFRHLVHMQDHDSTALCCYALLRVAFATFVRPSLEVLGEAESTETPSIVTK